MPENGFYGFPCAQPERARDFRASGKPGATAGAELAGGTTSGAPTSGRHERGEVVVDQTAGTLWICTGAGTPGTWTQVVGGSGSYTLPDATTSATGGLEVDQAPASGHPVALTAPRLGVAAGVPPLGPDALVPSAYLPLPAPTDGLAEAGRWVQSAGNPVLSAAATWEGTAVVEACVLYDGGLFKMWYRGGWATTAVGYATSSDGVTWTKYGGNPVVGQGGSGIAGNAQQPSVVKQGGLYYLFFALSNDIRLATSTDGIAWTLSSTVLFTPGGGVVQWAAPVPWRDAAGTWHMLLTGALGAGNWHTFVASSPDALTWTLGNSGSPVSGLLINAGGTEGPSAITTPQQIGGLYQLWYGATPGSGGLPGYIYRATSPDLITWTALATPIIQPSGAGNDQSVNPCVLEVNGTSWLYYDQDNNTTGVADIRLARFAGTLQQITAGAPVVPSETVGRGTHAQRPAAGLAGVLFVESDTKKVFRDNGSTWDEVDLTADVITAGTLAQARGGTGVDTSGATNGQLLIGKSADHSLQLAALTAGTNITITNGAGAVTVAATGGGSTSPLSTKGDVWGYSTTDARVPVGADGLALVADSTQSLGVRWGAPQPSSLLVLLPNVNSFVVDGTSDEQPPDFVTLANGDVVGVGGL